jgi:ribonuclease HII
LRDRKPTARRLFRFDRKLGTRFVAGADEAGRGSLAGPLVAAAVLFDYEQLTTRQVRALRHLDDSKVHDIEERERLYPLVLCAAARVAVTSRCARGIDERGLHVTNLAALRDCLLRVAPPGAICLVDGFKLPDCGLTQEAVVDGDARSAAIAAASVIAKVTRDRYMRRAAEELPDWHFHTNVGYSTPEHRDAIAIHGISALHRRSFQSVAYQQLAIEAG